MPGYNFMTAFFKKVVVLIVYGMLGSFSIMAQEPEGSPLCVKETKNRIDTYKSLGLAPAIDVSYVGYSTSLLVEYERRLNGFYAGPQILITSSYLPRYGPYGVVAGYKFYFINSLKRWKIYVNLDYKNFLFRAYKGPGETGKKMNLIQEFNLGYGMQYQISGPIFIGNSIHFGKYFESYYNYRLEERNGFSGYDGLIRLFVKYRIL